ncbi:hypothetical protein [Pseudarthrobacter sp. CCNWLW207]|uniref:hypothetical protein n=1 Tax=Pseudarthrobacter sp. CCNWLW207 TaxID=3127468 RepID=UPI0030781E9D
MGNKISELQLTQLGPWEVERSTLHEVGMSWDEIVSRWFSEENVLPPRASDDFPLIGWRRLQTSYPSWALEMLVLGAPDQASPGRWVLVQLHHDKNGWQFAGPASYLPIPVQELRRQGLRLEWSQPKFMMTKGSPPEIAVVLINDAASTWNPSEEDHSHVQGIVLDYKGNRIGSGWYAHGKAAQLPPLAPGQQLVLPALLNNPELDGLVPGRYQIRASLIALGLPTTILASLTVADQQGQRLAPE